MTENRCPNCERKVPVREAKCPYCGIPLYFTTNADANGADASLNQKNSEKSGCGCTFFIIIAVILAVAIIISYG